VRLANVLFRVEAAFLIVPRYVQTEDSRSARCKGSLRATAQIVKPKGYDAALNTFAVVVLALAYGLSFAALIFSGKLEGGVGLAVDAAFGAIVIGGVLAALRSAFPFAIGGPDSNPTAVFAAVAATMATSLTLTRAVPTVLMMMVLITACSGIAFFLLGRFGAGRVVRLVPQPMIGGFNALSGVLVLLGAMRVLAGRSLHLAALSALGTPIHIGQIGAGVGFGILLILLRRRFGPIAISVAFVGAMIVSLVVAFILRDSLTLLRNDGWLFKLPHVIPWLPWTVAGGSVDWAIIGAHWSDLVVVVLVAVAALLINATGLELLSGQDVDMNRELRIAGIGNMIGACVGTMISYVTFSRSAANFVLGLARASSG
jgi:SulP family sulfate permease